MNERKHSEIGKIRDALERNVNFSIPEDEWADYDSPLEPVEDPKGERFSMTETFAKTLPDYDKKSESVPSLKNYIEKTLSSGVEQRDLTAVEFGGSGSALFDGFTKDFFKKTVGVCLEDIRSEQLMDHDEQINHSVVAGDILDHSRIKDNPTLIEVKKILGTDKTDLIISRMNGPLNFIDKHGAILDRIIRNWYGMLNYNGLIFAQFDRGGVNADEETVEMVDKWVRTVKEKFPAIDIQVEGHAMRIHKREGSPDHLPPAKDLLK
jgi:hypothetical protein